MKVGDIVKIIDKYAMDSHKDHCGIVTMKRWDKCVLEAFPLNTGAYRTNMLEIISESR